MDSDPKKFAGNFCPPSVVDSLAKHMGILSENIETVAAHRLNQSAIFRVQVKGRSGAFQSDLFVKVRGIEPVATNRNWDPGREFAWATTMAAAGRYSGSACVPEPIAYGVDPNYFACQYFEGGTLHSHLRARDPITKDRAVDASGKLGKWLRSVRQYTLDEHNQVDLWEAVEELFSYPVRANWLIRRELDRIGFKARAVLRSREQRHGCAKVPWWVCHGDLIPLNVLVGTADRIGIVDFEKAHASPLSDDVWQFRIYLEQAVLNRMGAGRQLLSEIWRAFWREYTTDRDDGVVESAVYLIKLHRHLRHMVKLGFSRAGSARGMRDAAWVLWRLRWSSRLPDSASQIVRYVGRGL